MGLDMYLYTEDGEEVGYWRKHPDLHGFIVKTFAGGVDECQKIPLSSNDLTKILSAVLENKLPHTTGFFFGRSLPEDRQETIEILTSVIVRITGTGEKIHYQASW